MSLDKTRSVFIATATILLLSAIIPTTHVNAQQSTVNLTWFGFTTFEIATPDYSSVVYANPNIWRYNQSSAFGINLKPQYENPDTLAQFLKENNSKHIAITLTNDHPDEIGDLFELAAAFQKAQLDYKIVVQSDLARNWLIPELTKKGIDPNVVLRIGYGGKVTVGDIRIIATLALHGSTPWPISMIIELNGARIWHTGGTAIFSDMTLIRRLYEPQIALISITDAQFSMGPREAGYATRLLRPEIAIPTHYLASEGQFAGVSTLKDVEDFKKYVDEFSFGKVKVVVLTLGEPFTYTAMVTQSHEIVQSGVKTSEQDQTMYLAGTGIMAFIAGIAASKIFSRKK
jgi:L-ascorbate metabolism protein UlaG (beta-lactamase superfamily)